MIRVVIYLLIVGLIAFGAVWFADRPGDVAITWQGFRIETSVMVMMVAVVAVASGDARAARKLAEEASRIAPGEPLTLLLGAQAAQLSGDRASAERAFHVMASRDDTRLLGLHGLYIEAQRRADHAAARLYAEEAAKLAPAPA